MRFHLLQSCLEFSQISLSTPELAEKKYENQYKILYQHIELVEYAMFHDSILWKLIIFGSYGHISAAKFYMQWIPYAN